MVLSDLKKKSWIHGVFKKKKKRKHKGKKTICVCVYFLPSVLETVSVSSDGCLFIFVIIVDLRAFEDVAKTQLCRYCTICYMQEEIKAISCWLMAV